MSHTPNYDAKIKVILDNLEPGEHTCELTGEKWMMTEEEIGWYKKFQVPPSRCSPMTRMKYQLGFASGVVLWWKTHAITGQPILSLVHPDSPYKVITDKEWMSTDFIRSGPQADNTLSFFEQFRSLAYSIPVGALRDDGSNQHSFGVDYISCEDCYMIFGAGFSRRIFYGYPVYECEDSVDVTNIKFSRLCHAVNRSTKLHNCSFAFESHHCLNASFLFDCSHCEFCFGATNKRYKKYLWFNEQLSKEEWEERRKNVSLSSRQVFSEYQQKFLDLVTHAVWPENFNEKNTDSSGEYVDECVRCSDGFWLSKCTDCDWCWLNMEETQTAYSSWCIWGNDIYATCDVVSSRNVKFCFRAWRCQNMEYCMDCYDSENCFGCVGLRKKKFCLFNVQYTEEEYWQRVDILKCAMLERGEYGEYFPADLSQNGFSYSPGELFFGYSQEEQTQFHIPFFDPLRGTMANPLQHTAEMMSISQLPDNSQDPRMQELVGKPFYDSILQRPFSIASHELAFYQSRELPLPNQHFLTRLRTLVRLSNSPFTDKLSCASCQTTINAHRNGTFTDRKIFCRPCYQRFIEQGG